MTDMKPVFVKVQCYNDILGVKRSVDRLACVITRVFDAGGIVSLPSLDAAAAQFCSVVISKQSCIGYGHWFIP